MKIILGHTRGVKEREIPLGTKFFFSPQKCQVAPKCINPGGAVRCGLGEGRLSHFSSGKQNQTLASIHCSFYLYRC